MNMCQEETDEASGQASPRRRVQPGERGDVQVHIADVPGKDSLLKVNGTGTTIFNYQASLDRNTRLFIYLNICYTSSSVQVHRIHLVFELGYQQFSSSGQRIDEEIAYSLPTLGRQCLLH